MAAMGNIKGRLTRLENWAGGNMAVIVIRPGETEEQARENYYVAHPRKESGTPLKEIFFVVMRENWSNGKGLGNADA
jgi:hypothetical protein